MKWYIQGLVFGYLSAPQRTGRQGRGLEMVDGHQEHSTRLGSLTRSSLRLLFSSSSLKCVAPLALVELVARTVHRGSIYSGELLVRRWIVFKSRILELGLLQVNSTVSSIELSFLCLDSIESGGRAGASGLGSLPPSLRVVFSFPWLERRGSVRLLGRSLLGVVRSDLLLRNVGAWSLLLLA
ncbi:unnamed protein product [Microthlaspi erraticum]|uniref:Uncharacterized protein n=1 Tax=Microthlaspi erraticum TaxID=1685480 RepID=A0A6D2K0H5_9BRAS|nr:unnamed protein product [Microthlaspi erraticum]